MPNVTTFEHAGKAMLHIDFRGCTPGNFAPIIREALAVIGARPRDSVLALTNVEDVRFDPGTVAEMQRFVSAAMPYLKANAIVGVTGMKAVVFNGIKPLYRAPVELCATEVAARTWLAAR